MNYYKLSCITDSREGKKVEIELLKHLNSIYNNKFKPCPNKYDLFDITNKKESKYIELKSRKIKKNQYPTTIVGTNKINKSRKYKKENINTYYMFKFHDDENIYYIKYRPKIFDTFEKKIILRRDRGIYKEHTLIPIHLLKVVNKTNLIL